MARGRAFALLLLGACFVMPRQSRVLRRAKEERDSDDLLATAFKGGPPLRLTERGVEVELGSGAEGAGCDLMS